MITKDSGNVLDPIDVVSFGSPGVIPIDPAVSPTADWLGIDLDTGVLWKADTGEYYSIPDGIARTDLLQWLRNDKSKQVGNFTVATDKIELSSIPAEISTGNFEIYGSHCITTPIAVTQYLWNLTSSTEASVLFGAQYIVGDQISIIVRDKDGVTVNQTFGSWDGKCQLKMVFSGTTVTCYGGGVQIGLPKTILDVSDPVLFPFDEYFVGTNGDANPIFGMIWDFWDGSQLIPINDNASTIKNVAGQTVGTLTATPAHFWRYSLLLDQSSNDLHGVYNRSPYVITADGSEDRLVGFFEAPTQVTVPMPQEITSEWQCFFDTSIIQDDPLYFERLYELPTSGVAFRVYIDTDAYPSTIIANGNGVSGLILAPDVIFKDILQRVQVYMRLGGIKVIVDGIDYGEKAATWLQTSWSSFIVGGSSISVGYTGVMLGFTACNSGGDESWTFPSLVGSLGTVATITGGTNFSTKGIQYKTNMNLSADSALTTAGILNTELSQSEINALHDGSTIFTDASEIKTLVYSAAQTGTDQAAALTYVGK